MTIHPYFDAKKFENPVKNIRIIATKMNNNDLNLGVVARGRSYYQVFPTITAWWNPSVFEKHRIIRFYNIFGQNYSNIFEYRIIWISNYSLTSNPPTNTNWQSPITIINWWSYLSIMVHFPIYKVEISELILISFKGRRSRIKFRTSRKWV